MLKPSVSSAGHSDVLLLFLAGECENLYTQLST